MNNKLKKSALFTVLLIVAAIGKLAAQFSLISNAAGLYYAAYGDSKNPPVIFIHGGPGYNSAEFEFTTARALAYKGFYVIVWDQRGCGRSKQVAGSFSINETVEDLNSLYATLHLQTASLIGHSWGGVVAARFALKYPQKIHALIFTSSPLSYSHTLHTMIIGARNYYTARNEVMPLKNMEHIEKMDTTTFEYYNLVVTNALRARLSYAKKRNAEAQYVYRQLLKEKDYYLISENEPAPVAGYLQNDHFTSLNMKPVWDSLMAMHILVFGIYGSEDGIFDTYQLGAIKNIIGKDNYFLIPRSGHEIFIDRQSLFLDILTSHIKP